MVDCILEGAVSILTAMHFAYSQPVVQYVDLDSPLLFKKMPAELDGVSIKDRIQMDKQILHLCRCLIYSSLSLFLLSKEIPILKKNIFPFSPTSFL